MPAATSLREWSRAGLLVALGLVGTLGGLDVAVAAWWLSFVPYAAVVAVVVLWKRWAVPSAKLLALALPLGVVLGVYSILTGVRNGLTDEPWAFPLEQAMLFHGIDPYSVVHIAVNPYTGTATPGRLWELPLTVVLLVPRIPYGYQMLGCWVALVVLLRRRDAGVVLAQPLVALLAANGFSDFLPLLLLTVAYVGAPGRSRAWVEALALGIKQFANVVVVLRYLWRRDWFGLARAVLVTAVWVVPFLLWAPRAFYCGAIVFDVPASCPVNDNLAGAHGVNPLSLNYWLWPLWVLALGWNDLPAAVRRWLEIPVRRAP